LRPTNSSVRDSQCSSAARGSNPWTYKLILKRVSKIKSLYWQTHAHGRFEPQRLFRALANPQGRP
jgi:hypothetical protein